MPDAVIAFASWNLRVRCAREVRHQNLLIPCFLDAGNMGGTLTYLHRVARLSRNNCYVAYRPGRANVLEAAALL